MIIYKATNTTNGKSYIGQTVRSLAQRKASHKSEAKHNRANTSFHCALRKYKPENFTWLILKECNTLEELTIYETEYIKKYNTVEEGYNTESKGSNGTIGWKQTEEVKQQVSEATKGNNLGNQFAKGHTVSEEHRLILYKASIGNQRAKGYEFSEETKQKRIGNQYAKGKPVVINNQYFKTIQEASDSTNIPRATLVRMINRQIEGCRFA